jgi:spore coat polysaccharide biosynthesis protein SpsF
MSRRLVAVLPVRARGKRLYGKPLQSLADGVTILEQSVTALRTFDFVEEVVLGIADGLANAAFKEEARRLDCPFVIGPEPDVLGRVVAGGRLAAATDVVRKTSEDPFFDYDMLETAWHCHIEDGNDATVLDHVPEGTAFEIITLAALERCETAATGADREHITDLIRFNQRLFRVAILPPHDPACKRPDLRLSVDNPEDLIVARCVYGELREFAPRVPLRRIIELLDARADLRQLVAPFASGAPVWDGIPQRES